MGKSKNYFTGFLQGKNNMSEVVNSQQETQRDLNYVPKIYFLKPVSERQKEQNKTGDNQRFIYIIRLPQNRPQAYV